MARTAPRSITTARFPSGSRASPPCTPRPTRLDRTYVLRSILMSDSKRIVALATRLREAEASRNVIEPVRGEIALGGIPLDDIATAYAVQQANVDLRVANGERIVGRKIGLTSLAVQKQLGVDQPDFGALFASMAYGDSQPMPLGELI